MILRYTPLARQDLHEIEDYIKNELANPQAAKNTVQRILKGCSMRMMQMNISVCLCEQRDRALFRRVQPCMRFIEKR